MLNDETTVYFLVSFVVAIVVLVFTWASRRPTNFPPGNFVTKNYLNENINNIW